jgi:hypothetical protein
MKSTTKLWYGLGVTIARAGTAAVAGTALLPAALAGPAGEAGEGGQGTQPAAHGQPAGEAGESGYSSFQGDLDKAVSNIFAGEGGEGGAGLSRMWPSITIPALSSADIKKVVSGNTLRTDGHVAWYLAPDLRIEGGFVEWKATDAQSCPQQEIATDAFHRGTDGVCYTYKLYPSKGTWSVRDNQLCVNVSWDTGAKNDCRYVAILLEDIVLFDQTGKIDGKGMKLLKGKSIAK